MKVKINSKEIETTEGITLAALLESQGLPTAGIATAVNGKVIPAPSRASHVVSSGDNIVIIKAFYGG